MDKTTKNALRTAALALLAAAALGGCATARTTAAPEETASAAAAEDRAVLRPAPSYGSMGGYRYRRFVIVHVARAS